MPVIFLSVFFLVGLFLIFVVVVVVDVGGSRFETPNPSGNLAIKDSKSAQKTNRRRLQSIGGGALGGGGEREKVVA